MAPAELTVFAAHGRHSPPLLALNVPAGQSTQAVLSALGAVPAGHRIQLGASSIILIVPGGHTEQIIPFKNDPAGH